jgi:hypothetical protein
MMLEEIYTKSILLITYKDSLLYYFDLLDWNFSNWLDLLKYIVSTFTRVGGYTTVPPTYYQQMVICV